MKLITTVFLVAAGHFLSGCVSPPKPSQCQGEFHPVNALAHVGSADQGQHAALCIGKGDHEERV